MTERLTYTKTLERPTIDDCHEALTCIFAVEPDPLPEEQQDYNEAILPYYFDIERTMVTLRRYAEQLETKNQKELGDAFNQIARDDRYLTSRARIDGMYRVLNICWHGVGDWR